jgi:hypothetical protein
MVQVLQNPVTYVQKKPRPYTRYLQNQALFDNLLKIFTQYAKNADGCHLLKAPRISISWSQLRILGTNSTPAQRVRVIEQLQQCVKKKNMGEIYIVKAMDLHKIIYWEKKHVYYLLPFFYSCFILLSSRLMRNFFLSPGKHTTTYIERKQKKGIVKRNFNLVHHSKGRDWNRK